MAMEAKFSKALGIVAAFLGIGFLASALERFLGWDTRENGWKAGGVTLGATLVAYVGLRAFGGAKYANMALIGGLAATGVHFLQAPVNNAGAKLGDWMRSWGRNDGTTKPAMTQDKPQSAPSTGYEMTGAVPTTSMTPAATQPTGGGQPQSVTIIQQAPKDTSSAWERLLGTAITAGSSIVGDYLKGSGDDSNHAYAKLGT